MKNWKTTVGGFIGAVGMALTVSGDPKLHITGIGVCAVATLWFGWHAADK